MIADGSLKQLLDKMPGFSSECRRSNEAANLCPQTFNVDQPDFPDPREFSSHRLPYYGFFEP